VLRPTVLLLLFLAHFLIQFLPVAGVPGAHAGSSWPTSAATQPAPDLPQSYQQIYAARLWSVHEGRVFSLAPARLDAGRWRTASQWPTYENWLHLIQAEMQLVRDSGTASGAAALLGDSLLFWYPQVLHSPRQALLNLAIAGENTGRLAARAGVLRGTGAARVLVLIGINDYLAARERGGGRLTAATAALVRTEILAQLARLVTTVHEVVPGAEIAVLSLLPTRGDRIANGVVIAHNQALRQAVPAWGARYIDVHRHLVGRGTGPASVQIEPALTTDGLHLSFAGYLRLARALDAEL
jgi:lysophospholipase L1-like esterase